MNPPSPAPLQPSWRILQIADSSFPTGGFAHSAGLEATMALGEVATAAALDTYVAAHLWNTGHAALPFVGAAHDRSADLPALCDWIDATLTNHVVNRASRTQGRAFLATCAQVFVEPYVVQLSDRARRREVTPHLAPVFGAVLCAIGVARRDTLALHLHLALRGIVSAAVRLGAVGPLEAQRLQLRHGATLDSVLAECSDLRPEDAATVAPLHDICGATHDALYARLFQS